MSEITASSYLWEEGLWPLFEHVPGTLPTNWKPVFWQPPEWKEICFKMSTPLLGDVIRNDSPERVPVINAGVLVGSPLLYFFGCDVIPKTIHIDEILEADYFVPIQISNNNFGKWIEIRSLTIVDDPFDTMEILGHNWPKMLAPYSVETYILKISGTAGYPEFESTLIVDAGTCYTEIPITGVRNVDCPICPPIVICPPEEEIDMAQCMIEQQLCAISRGDSVPFNFRFTENGDPLKITGMTLQLILKEDIKQKEPDMIKEVIFPDDANSDAGLGNLRLYPDDTMKLRAGVTYCFKFKLLNGALDVSTVGLGTLPVNPDPASEEV